MISLFEEALKASDVQEILSDKTETLEMNPTISEVTQESTNANQKEKN